MKTPLRIVCVLLASILLVGLGGCAGPGFTPQQQQQQITDARAVVDTLKTVSTQLGAVSDGLKEVKAQAQATAATQPAAQAPAHAIEQAVDKATPAIDKTQASLDAVTHVADTFGQALTSQQAANASTVDKLVAVTQVVSQTAHVAAPGTPVDNYAALAAVLVLGVSKIVSSINNKATLKTALTTPGTTLPTTPPTS